MVDEKCVSVLYKLIYKCGVKISIVQTYLQMWIISWCRSNLFTRYDPKIPIQSQSHPTSTPNQLNPISPVQSQLNALIAQPQISTKGLSSH